MGLTPGPLVRALFLFTLMNPLVVLNNLLVVFTNTLVMSVAWDLTFFFTGIYPIGDDVPFFVFVPKGLESKCGRLIEIFWRTKY